MLKKHKVSFVYLFSIMIFLIFTLGPLVWALIISLTPTDVIMSSTGGLIPRNLTLDNYKIIFDLKSGANEVVINGLINSLYTVLCTWVIGLPLAILTSYSLVRFQIKFKLTWIRLLLITIVIPVFTTITPIYAFYSQWKLLDNLFWISVIYVTAFLPLVTWMLINHFSNIPREMWEAAELDGCTEWQIFRHIIMPLSRTALVTSILILLLMAWSQFQIPMILTSSQENKVITLILSEFMSRDAIDYGMISSVGMIAIIPPAIITFIFSKAFVTGITSGSVKG